MQATECMALCSACPPVLQPWSFVQGIAGIFTCTRQRERIYARHKGYARLAIQAGVGAAPLRGTCSYCAQGVFMCALRVVLVLLQPSFLCCTQACDAAPCMVAVGLERCWV